MEERVNTMTPNNKPSQPLEIGWPPIDLNDTVSPSPDKLSLPGSLAVAFVGGVLLGSVGLPVLAVGAMEYYREREKHPRWSAFLGAGILTGLIALLAAIVKCSK